MAATVVTVAFVSRLLLRHLPVAVLLRKGKRHLAEWLPALDAKIQCAYREWYYNACLVEGLSFAALN